MINPLVQSVLWCVASVVSLARVQAQSPIGEVHIAPAAQLSFTAAPQSFSGLLASDDLKTWRVVEQAFTRDGTNRSVFVSAEEKAGFYRSESHQVDDLSALLEPIRANNKVPALSAVVVLSNRVVGIGAVGVRKIGTQEPVTIDDKWHIGSCTKSVTATLAAMLVADGAIRWNSTLAEVFPEYSASMEPQWRTVTLEWLVQNRSGAAETVETGLWNALWNFSGSPRDSRLYLLTNVTKVAPAAAPGTSYIYSNTGFSLAGAMLEKVSNRPWESLVQERIFNPLEMRSSGFGVPASPRYLNQPWGHNLVGTTVTPVQPGIAADNPPAIGPSATIHASLLDLAKYVQFHLEGSRGDTKLLSQALFTKLHTRAPGQDYAMGWNVVARDWAGGDALNHAGSNTHWYTLIWMAPNREFGVVANTNFGASAGQAAVQAVVTAVIQKYL